mgnify:CR=1 FL=1
MKKFLYAILAASTLFFSSCTKEEDDNKIDISKPVMLQRGYWQMTSYKVQANYYDPEQFPVEQIETLDQCLKDNVWVFTSDTELKIEENFMKCVITDPDVRYLYYDIYGSDTWIKIWSNPDDIDNSIVLNGEIKNISADEFIVKSTTYDEATQITTLHVRGFTKYIPQ